ncbi:MAG: CRISPR-associated endonuclease Cas2 [Desulfobacca sp. 4484_104]|nr:MAG: CRISPR-associated endonuclease Cas2 [Desulfobacca sp. 4484_104]
MFVVISYDIEDDRRRTKVRQTLRDYGKWVQFSVFECNLPRPQFERLRHQLASLICMDRQDSIRFYFLCENCQGKIARLGCPEPQEPDSLLVV